jgi:starch-binding outer membrane protein, SusD/RagB family
MYLWQKKYLLAAEAFEKIILNSQFSLVYPMSHVYDGEHEFGPESVWELNYSEKSMGLSNAYHHGTFHHFTLIHSPKFGWPNIYVSQHAIKRFGNDPRRVQSIAMKGDVLNAETGLRMGPFDKPFTRKFITTSKISGDREPGWVSNIVIMRLSDIYLHYAECQNELGNDGLALQFVNRVRKRAHDVNYMEDDANVDDLIAYKNIEGSSLRDTIREERWRELYYEFHRWYDIRRWKILEQEIEKAKVTSAGERHFDERDYYWPIPRNETRANPNLLPSTGYN